MLPSTYFQLVRSSWFTFSGKSLGKPKLQRYVERSGSGGIKEDPNGQSNEIA